MQILIIGGTGLISTAITRDLAARGDRVTVFNRGRREAEMPPDITLLRGDRTDYAAFEAQMAEAGPFDCVIDMVGYAPEDAASAVRAFRGRVGQFVFCSTVDVYQKPASRYPTTEDEPYGGLNAYSRNKVTIERTLLAAQDAGGFPLTILRPAATYGEGRAPLSPLSGRDMYFDRLRRGKPLIVHGDGSALWTSCWCEDVAHAFVAAVGNPRAIGRAYHTAAAAIGAPAPTLVHLPTDVLVRATARAALIGENFQFNNVFDNAVARADLDFRPTLPWREGVRRMFTWLAAHGRIANSDDDPFEDRLIAAWERAGAALTAAFLKEGA